MVSGGLPANFIPVDDMRKYCMNILFSFPGPLPWLGPLPRTFTQARVKVLGTRLWEGVCPSSYNSPRSRILVKAVVFYCENPGARAPPITLSEMAYLVYTGRARPVSNSRLVCLETLRKLQCVTYWWGSIDSGRFCAISIYLESCPKKIRVSKIVFPFSN